MVKSKDNGGLKKNAYNYIYQIFKKLIFYSIENVNKKIMMT